MKTNETLPEGWTLLRFPATVEVYNASGQIVHGEPVPYDPVSELDLRNRAICNACDPCLRNPALPRNGGHARNGWQLHYKQ